MAPPAWAYQVDLFDPPPDEELVCSICRGVFCDPVQCQCRHVYCRVCITRWLENNRNCPICRKRTTKYRIEEVVPLIKNMIMKLQMLCHNSERGCQDKFSLETCETHIRDCVFELVRCKNKRCKEMCLRKDIQAHELNDCPHHYIRCQKCCLKVSSKLSPGHDCIKALKRKLRARDQLYKKQAEHVKQLQNEIKSLREADRDTSSSTSLASTSLASLSTTDIMISVRPDYQSSSNNSSYFTDSDDNLMDDDDWMGLDEVSVDDITSNPHDNDADNFSLAETSNNSIELPRSSTPGAPSGSRDLTFVDSALSDNPQGSRPAKRRMMSQVLDSSDDSLDVVSFPSPKRNWSANFNSEGNESVQILSGGAGPSSQAPALAANTIAAVGGIRFRLRPRLQNKVASSSSNQAERTLDSAEAAVGSIVPRRQAFEKTLQLLEQYNLESDPEWSPPSIALPSPPPQPASTMSDGHDDDNDDDDDDVILPQMDGHITSSDESSISISSDSSDFEASRMRDFMFSFSTSSDDDEWHPH